MRLALARAKIDGSAEDDQQRTAEDDPMT